MSNTVTITYNPEDPASHRHLKRHSKALDMAIALWEIEANLMRRLEYKLQLDTQDWDAAEKAGAEQALSALSEELHEIYEEQNLMMADLVI